LLDSLVVLFARKSDRSAAFSLR